MKPALQRGLLIAVLGAAVVAAIILLATRPWSGWPRRSASELDIFSAKRYKGDEASTLKLGEVSS